MAFRAVVEFSLERELWNLRNDERHCDVFLQGSEANSTKIPAHRVVLSARSPYFRAMFNSNMQESRQEHVQLRNIPGATLLMLVKYAYTSEVNVDEANVVSLLEGAIFLDLEPLAATCWNFLGLCGDPGHMLLFYCLAELYQYADLANKAKTQVLRHFRSVSQSAEFSQLERDQVITLIGSDNITIEHEDVILDAVFSWIRYDPAERTPMLTELLSMVRLAHVDRHHLHCSVVELIGQVRDCGADLSDQIYRAVEEALCVDSQPRESCEFLHVLVCVGKKVRCIDPRTGVATVLGDVPEGLYLPGAVVLDRDAFVLGLVDFQNGYRLPVLYRFGLDLGIWTRLASPRSSHLEGCVVALAGRIYAVGGRDDNWDADSTVECYDPANNLWARVAECPLPLLRFGSTVHQGCLFTFGGIGLPQAVSVFRYDPHIDVWTVCLEMPGPRIDCSACLGDDDMIYVLGGEALTERGCSSCGHSHHRAETLDGYNPRTNEWISIGTLPFAGCRVAVGTAEGYVYVVGAYDLEAEIRSVQGCAENWSSHGIQAFDGITRTWSIRTAPWPLVSYNPTCSVVKFTKALLNDYPVHPRVVIEKAADDEDDDSLADDEEEEGDGEIVWN